MTDSHDLSLALLETLDIIEWMVVADKKRLGNQDTKKMLNRIDLARSVLSTDEENDDADSCRMGTS